MECAKLQNCHFCFNNINKLSRLYLYGGYTGNRYPLYVSFSGKTFGGHIDFMEIILSVSTWSITTNEKMVQPSNIFCGGTHHSWSNKIAQYQDQVVYILEIKWISMMILFCFWGVICGYNPCVVVFPIFIFCIFVYKKQPKQKENKRKKTGDDTLCGNTLLPVNHKIYVPHCRKLPK